MARYDATEIQTLKNTSSMCFVAIMIGGVIGEIFSPGTLAIGLLISYATAVVAIVGTIEIIRFVRVRREKRIPIWKRN